MKFIKRKGFTLVEIAVVILVIGVLIAGISQAMEMFAEASLKSARNLSKSSRLGRVDDLTLWFDATSEKAFDKEKGDGSAVSIWKDTNPKSTTTIFSSSSVASLYPSYTLSAINSLPAVSFKKTSASVGNCVTVPNQSFINSSEDFTLYLIYSPKTLDDGIILEKNNATATTFPFSLELLSGYYKFSVKNSSSTISVTSPKQAKIKAPNLIRLSRIKGSQIEIIIDGVSTTETDTLTSSTLNNAELSIGCRNGATPANFISGDFGETAFFNRNINVKEKADIEEYLYKKWKMKKFEGTLPAVTAPAPAITCTLSQGTGYSAKTLLPVGSSTFSCDTGYTGTISYTCPSSGGTISGTGSCTAITCSLAGGTGYTAKTLLPVGSSTFSCDVSGYTGTISYTCPSSGGTATISGGSGSCTAIVNTCSLAGGTGYSAKTLLPIGSDSFPCDTGFTGTINYNCPSSGGTATITSGSCTAITCSLAGGTGYSAKSQLPVGSGSFSCNTGFHGTINYNCPSSGGTATVISEDCGCLYTEAGGTSRCLLEQGDTRKFSINESIIIPCPYGASGNSNSNPPARDMKYKCYANGTSKFGIRRRCSYYDYHIIHYSSNPTYCGNYLLSINNWGNPTNACLSTGEDNCNSPNLWLQNDNGPYAW